MRGVEETDWGYRWCGRLRWPRTLNIRATRARVGEWGERLALRHVRNLGWDVMARNWKTARGELDLIAHDGTQLVVIEVRTRRRDEALLPEETINSRKERQLESLAMDFLRRHEITDIPVRFEVIAIETADFRNFELRQSTLDSVGFR